MVGETVPAAMVGMWTLGQNGFVLKTEGSSLVAIDPYLTDYCNRRKTGQPGANSRILPVFVEPEDFQVDVILLTHGHCDHSDPETLIRYRNKADTHVVAPWQAAEIARQAGFDRVDVIHPGQQIRWRDISIAATFAEPTDATDLNHVGYLLSFDCGKVYYNSGDTARTESLRYLAGYGIDWMTVCTNAGYRNLSHWDAAEVASWIRPKIAIPSHFDMMPQNVQPPHMFRKSLSVLCPEVKYMRLDYYKLHLF
jgi:L-ascorbate 6-phosphate lactonase